MTDDEVAGECPYKLTPNGIEGPGVGPNDWGIEACFSLNTAFAAGRKAERDRCTLIAETEIVEHQDGEESYLCGTGKLIAEKIRGGQDEK